MILGPRIITARGSGGVCLLVATVCAAAVLAGGRARAATTGVVTAVNATSPTRTIPAVLGTTNSSMLLGTTATQMILGMPDRLETTGSLETQLSGTASTATGYGVQPRSSGEQFSTGLSSGKREQASSSSQAVFGPSDAATKASVFGTTNTQSAIDPAGRQAYHIDKLYWMYFWTLASIYVVVLAVLGWALLRRRRNIFDQEQELRAHQAQLREAGEPVRLAPADVVIPRHLEKGPVMVVAAAVAVTVVLLWVFLIGDFATGRTLNALASEKNPLAIKVNAQQWWWEIKYPDEVTTSNTVTTANEIYIPIGRPIRLETQSPDVIHSFWVPNLAGKHDIIPGYPVTFFLQADKVGTYWGQCAEFCGHQHAKMRFSVTALPEDEFQAWLSTQRQSAPSPSTESQKRGQQVFLGASCAMCHSISGTQAMATVGPNLSHIASRSMIAAGSLPNNRGNLAGWILDAQHIKPGCRMPQNNIPADDLEALLDYLESLK